MVLPDGLLVQIGPDRQLDSLVATIPDGPAGGKPLSVYLGVPAKLGAGGVEQIIEVKLHEDEQQALNKSVEAVNGLLKETDKYL